MSFSAVREFIISHYLIVGLVLLGCFVLSEKYLMPDELKFGTGEINTVKSLWKWLKEKTGRT